MRPHLLPLLALSAHSAEKPVYTPWDGQETIGLETVLIPAGTFSMRAHEQ